MEQDAALMAAVGAFGHAWKRLAAMEVFSSCGRTEAGLKQRFAAIKRKGPSMIAARKSSTAVSTPEETELKLPKGPEAEVAGLLVGLKHATGSSGEEAESTIGERRRLQSSGRATRDKELAAAAQVAASCPRAAGQETSKGSGKEEGEHDVLSSEGEEGEEPMTVVLEAVAVPSSQLVANAEGWRGGLHNCYLKQRKRNTCGGDEKYRGSWTGGAPAAARART